MLHRVCKSVVTLLTVLMLAVSLPSLAQVLVSSGDGNQVLEYDTNGLPLIGNPFASIDSPSGLAFGPDGKLYAASYNGQKLLRYNSDGTGETVLLSNIGLEGGMAFGPDGNLYITRNIPNNDILRYDPVSNTASSFVSGLHSPLDVAFDSIGRLYVSDYSSGSILRFKLDGTFDGVFASGIAGGVNGPAGLAIDGSGKVYVSVYRTGELLRFNSDGTFDATLALLAGFGPNDLAFGPDGKLYVCETGDGGVGNDVLRFNADGSFDQVFIASGSGGLHRALYLAFRPSITPTPLTITITTPISTSYLLNQTVNADYSCAGGVGGVASCVGMVPNGNPIDIASAGTKTFTVTATDNASNTATQSVSYTVGYAIQVLYSQTKAHKSGSTIPIKLQMVDANGVNVSSDSIVVTAISVIQVSTNAPGTLEDAGNSNPDNNFRYDNSLGGYIFNLKTTGYATGTYNLNFKAGSDPTLHTVQFQIR